MLHQIFAGDRTSPFTLSLPTDSAEEPNFFEKNKKFFCKALKKALINQQADEAAG